MKSQSLSALILGCLTTCILFSCSKFSESIERDVIITPDTIRFSITPVTTTREGTKLGEVTSIIDINNYIKAQANEFSAADLKRIKITSISLSLPVKDTVNNFAFIENMTVYSNYNDNLGKIPLAGVTGNPEIKNKALKLGILTDQDMQSFVKQPSMPYTFIGKVRNTTTKDIAVNMVVNYRATLSKD